MKNIINIVNNKIKLKLKKSEVICLSELKSNEYEISDLNLTVKRDTTILLNCLTNDFKVNIIVNLDDNVNCTLNIVNKIEKGKLKYTYNLGTNSKLTINKINDCTNIKELVMVSLLGTNSLIDYNFKSISKTNESYNIVVNHKSPNTTSDIKTNIANILSGVSNVDISTTIKKGMTGSIANQNTKIINLTNKKCEIKPNLYIDEYDSVANHSAYIGKFNKDELFYLMSRGLTETEASNLLIKGLLISDITSTDLILTIKKIINKYWR